MSIICEARQKGELVFATSRNRPVSFAQPGSWDDGTREHVDNCLRLCLRWLALEGDIAGEALGPATALAGLHIEDAFVQARPLTAADLEYAVKRPGSCLVFLVDPAGRQYPLALEARPDRGEFRFFDPTFGEFAFGSFERLRQWFRGFLCLSNYGHRFTRGFAFVRLAVSQSRAAARHRHLRRASRYRSLAGANV